MDCAKLHDTWLSLYEKNEKLICKGAKNKEKINKLDYLVAKRNKLEAKMVCLHQGSTK